ncbi:MAG: hypothetical protein V7731_04110 [Amphritea sp.]
MQITVTQILEKQPKKLSSREKKFQQAWRKVTKLKAENTTLATELDELVQLLEAKISPAEQTISLEYHALVDKKLRFLTMKSLTQWQRFELSDWIEQSFDKIQLLSQADPQRFQQQVKNYNEIVAPDDELFEDDFLGDPEQAEFDDAQEETPEDFVQDMLDAFIAEQKQQRQNFEKQQQASGQVDFLADESLEQFARQQAEELTEFKLHLDDILNMAQDEDPFSFSGSSDDFGFNHDDSDESFTSNTQTRLKTLFSDSSVKVIFRKLAKVLHPDREQDPKEIRRKQVLMSDALKARDEGDILTLFAMYSEHVSQDELSFDEKELDALNKLLMEQIEQLKNAKDRIAMQSQAHHKAFECFYDTSRKKIDKKINSYLQEIEDDKALIRELTSSLSSLRMLKPYLEDRRDAAFGNFSYNFNQFF